jgi:23S rRNA (guanosine2251-2'-O)-methyltransferase
MKKEKTQLIYGRHPVIDAIREGTTFDKIFIQQGTRGEFEKAIRQLCNEHNIPMTVAPKEKLNKFTRSNHQGVIGLVSLIPYYRIEDLLPSVYEKNENPLIIILDGITDVRNFGAIARSAEICGAHAIVVPKKGSALINAEALKTSAGALTKIPVCRENSLITAIETIQMSGITVLASSLNAQKHLFDFELTEPVAMVVGAEGEGISTGVERKADELFIIPQAGTTDSFNVSVATGIMLYEVMRQRMGR